MKMSISWHQENLANSTRYYKEQLDCALERFQTALIGIAKDEFKQLQITKAISQGKDGFDDDKFMKNERKKALEESKHRIIAQVCQLKASCTHLSGTPLYNKNTECLCMSCKNRECKGLSAENNNIKAKHIVHECTGYCGG